MKYAWKPHNGSRNHSFRSGKVKQVSTSCSLLNSLRPRDAYTCVRKLTIIGSDNGLAPAGAKPLSELMILLIVPSGTNLSEILIEENVVRKSVSILSQPQCVNQRQAASCHKAFISINLTNQSREEILCIFNGKWPDAWTELMKNIVRDRYIAVLFHPLIHGRHPIRMGCLSWVQGLIKPYNKLL